MLKKLGDRVIAAPVTAQWTRDDNTGPVVKATFDVIDGTLQCREVLIKARPGRPEVTITDLRAIPIGDLREQMVEFWSAPYEHSEGGTTLRVTIGDEEQARSARKTLAATRRKDDVETLRRVAEVYRANPKTPTKAVQEAFGVAHRTAGLYVQRARRAGLLPPAQRTKGK